jgi:outer membrane protein assembly factor BamB
MGKCTRCGAKAGFLMSMCDACISAMEAERAEESRTREAHARGRAAERTIDQLVFVGLNGYALALDRDTGEIVWSNGQMKSGYVSLLLDGDRLIVSTNGYMYCLDPLTGTIHWHNPLSGYGMGAPTHLVSVRGQSSQTQVAQAAAAEAARRQAANSGPHGAGS